MPQSDAQVSQFGNLRRSGDNIRLEGNCPLKMRIQFTGIVKCADCIQISDTGVSESVKWDAGFSLDVDMCLERGKCDCVGCCWGGKTDDQSGPIVFQYASTDCTGPPTYTDPGYLQCIVCFDRVAKTFEISLYAAVIPIGITSGIRIFHKIVDAMNCKDMVMAITNDYTGCYDFATDPPFDPPNVSAPHSIAHGGTATLSPGDC